MKIRNWYMKTFPSDECGADIDPNATFEGLWHVLAVGDDVYRYIGEGDSLIRERCFQKLSKIKGVTYDTIYSLWLKGA